MKKIGMTFCAFCCLQSAFACFNLPNGQAYMNSASHDKPLLNNAGYVVFSRTFSVKNADSLLVSQFHLDSIAVYNYDKRTKIAVLLTQFGRLDEALVIFEKLYNERQNDYIAVVNLGTIYELVGELDSAKALIVKAIRLNPHSHEDSEWFHVKVLEAKLALQNDPNWLLNHQVMNLSKKLNNEKTMALIRQITHQLHERLPFTGTPNLLITNVLNELGDLCALDYSIKEAYSAFLIALTYDPNDTYKIQDKLNKLKPQFAAYDTDLPLLNRVFNGDSTFVYKKIATPIIRAEEKSVYEQNKYTILSVLSLLSLSVLWYSKRFLDSNS
jgi:tetratricopeptide (TPR) repeat protein